MRPAVIDASVALRWVFPDEENGAAATRLLLAHHGGEVSLIAPALWEYEIANALRVGVARKRLEAGEAHEALQMLLAMGVGLFNLGATAERAWQLALEHGLTCYDAAYVALAQEHNCELFTGDRRLAQAAEATGVVRWIGDLAP